MAWTRHLFYRVERTRTTWKFRIGLLALLVVGAWMTRGWWTTGIGQSLVCQANAAPSDAILIENFDPSYLLFERAKQLRTAGLASRVLVPIPTDGGTHGPNAVALGTAELMARIARLGPIVIVPTDEIEPISLNQARDVLRFFTQEKIRSVIIVSPLFRSRRSSLVYDAMLGGAGVTVSCEPIAGSRNVGSWTATWHGIQEVTEQWIKLQYYRLYVLPFRLRSDPQKTTVELFEQIAVPAAQSL